MTVQPGALGRLDLRATQDRLDRLALPGQMDCPVCRESRESRVLQGLLGCLAYLEAMEPPEPVATTGTTARRA